MGETAKIVSWLDSRLRKGPLEIDLNHERGDRVESFELEENETSEAMVDRIFRAAQEDADGMIGPQRYWVVLKSGESKDVLSRKSIEVDGKPHEAGRSSESPDEFGLTAQAMRHMEGVLKMTLNAVSQTLQNTQRENERMGAQLTELSRVEIERMVMSRQLAQDVANQRIEEEKIKAKAERDRWLMRQVELILPVGVSKFFGPAVEDGPKWAQEADILVRIAGKLSPEQLSSVMLVFDPPSRLLLGSMMGGEVSQAIIPLATQRLMQALSQDQYVQIYRILGTVSEPHVAQEIRELFRSLYMVRKHGVEWAENAGLESSQPRYALPQSNGTIHLSAPEPTGTGEGESETKEKVS